MVFRTQRLHPLAKLIAILIATLLVPLLVGASDPALGCIDIQKETFDALGNPITPVTQFTFTLDGNVATTQNDSNGIAQFTNVSAGSHTVTEILPPGWESAVVTPPGGIVIVNAGNVCSTVTFKNRQLPLGAPLIRLTKTANKSTYLQGERVEYTITVENTGNATATGIIVTDPTPPGLTYVDSASDSLCNATQLQSGPGVACGPFTLAAGASKSLLIAFDVNINATCGATIQNVAVATANNAPQSNPASVLITVQCPPALGCIDIKKETFDALGNPITPVTQFTFTLDGNTTAVNDSNGNAKFTNVSAGTHTVTETLPPGWTLASVTPPNGTVIVASGASCSTVTFKNRQLPVGSPGLSITKTPSKSSLLQGERVSYTIRITNTGNGTATGIAVTDTIPTGLTYVDGASDVLCDQSGNSVSCGTFALNAGQSRDIIVAFDLGSTAACGSSITNTATVSAANAASQQSSAVITVSCPQEVGCIDIKKETFNVNGSILTPVTQFTFKLDSGTQTVVSDSAGNARFNNVPVGIHTVTETIPGGWTQLNVTPSNGQVTVIKGNICVTVTFKNKQDPFGTTQFTIDKTDNRTTASTDNTLTYQITVRNTGSVNATNVTVTDAIPGNTSFVSAGNGGIRSGNTVTWIFNLNAGASITLTMSVRIESNARDGDVINNTACISGGPCADDRTTVEIPGNRNGDVQISVDDDPDPIDACNDDDLEYEIRLSNSGNANEEVDVIALLDGNTEYRSSSDGGRERSNGRVEWDNVKVNRNSSRTLRLRVRISSFIRDGDTLRLRAAVSSGDEDTEITRVINRNCDPVVLNTLPDLTIDKTADRTEALPGSVVSYTITIRNTGTRDIGNAQLTDDYPESLVTISDAGGASDAGGTLTWNLGTLRTGSTTVVRYRARVKEGLARGTQIRNIATVRGDGLTRTDDHSIVVPTPPQTGLGGLLRSLVQSDAFMSDSAEATDGTTPVTDLPEARLEPVTETKSTLPMTVWMTTVMTGLSIGGFFGRRFLF